MKIFNASTKILFITLLVGLFSFSFIVSAEENTDLPSGDSGADMGPGVLPPRDNGDTSDDAPIIDVGMPPPQDTPPTSQNDAAAQGQTPTTNNTTGFTPNPSSLFGQNVDLNEVTNIFGQVVPANGFGGAPLNTLLNQVFYLGLGIAVILAIIMIVRGGIQYMTIDAATSKDSGKKMVQAALGGLVLAFAGILILNTINPKLTELNLSFSPLQAGATLLDSQIMTAVSAYNSLTPEQKAQMLATGKIPEGISPAAQAILAEALNAVGNMKTGAIPGTDGGNKACAAALNKIVEAATGQPVGGGLSTAAMYEALQNNPRFALVAVDGSSYQPGDIVISPTSGNSTGHVGIVATANGDIISNSSSNAEVRQNYTMTSWKTRYDGKGLPTYVYRPI